MKRAFLFVVMIVLAAAVVAAPAMAEEKPLTASVQVSEYINFTIRDSGSSGISFSNLNPGAVDAAEASQNATTPAVELIVGKDTNVKCSLNIRASGDFIHSTDSTKTINIANAKWDTDSDPTGARLMSQTSSLVGETSPSTSDTSVKVWHFLSVPSNAVAGSYSTTFWYEAVKRP